MWAINAHRSEAATGLRSPEVQSTARSSAGCGSGPRGVGRAPRLKSPTSFSRCLLNLIVRRENRAGPPARSVCRGYHPSPDTPRNRRIAASASPARPPDADSYGIASSKQWRRSIWPSFLGARSVVAAWERFHTGGEPVHALPCVVRPGLYVNLVWVLRAPRGRVAK